MLPETPYIDIQARKAAIPGAGDERVAWTHTKDVARFVRKMVESMEPWPAKSIIVGDTISLNEILKIAQEARGKLSTNSLAKEKRRIKRKRREKKSVADPETAGTEFEVSHDSLSDLRAGKITEIPGYKATYDVFPKEMLLEMMAAIGVGMITGVFDLEAKGELINDRFPEVKPVRMREFIRSYWEGR